MIVIPLYRQSVLPVHILQILYFLYTEYLSSDLMQKHVAFFSLICGLNGIHSGMLLLQEKQIRHDTILILRLLLLFSRQVMSNSFATPWTGAVPNSSVHGLSQARILEWVTFPSPDLPDPSSNPSLLHWQADSLLPSHLETLILVYVEITRSCHFKSQLLHLLVAYRKLRIISNSD